MKTTETGDQSGGLKREHGGSTPVKSGGDSGGDDKSGCGTVSTEDKNAPGAFTKEPGGANDSGPGNDGRLQDGADTGSDGS